MPELPEVERAARLVKLHTQGKRICRVETTEDPIVYSGISPAEFANAVRSRVVVDVKRYGKVFYLDLDGNGLRPVLHFGMTGNVLVKGQEPLRYKEGPKKRDEQWPPRFTKFILELCDAKGCSEEISHIQIAFIDPRRLGRIRLCKDPMNDPPISLLGFDPILCMPTLDEFSKKVLRRSCPVKALLLDQSFSAGVGNWVADEILYHSRVHPEQRCNTLSSDQVTALHENTSYVCHSAVSVNADSDKFPDNWLFNHRWGKGKRKHPSPLMLPSGKPATIRWLKVGGRTSAFVEELQSVQSSKVDVAETGTEVDEESPLTSLSDSEENLQPPVPQVRKRQQRQRQTQPKDQKRQRMGRT